jgi:hypothetical protein
VTVSVPQSVQRELRRLDPGDSVIPMVELVFEFEDPGITSAVVCKLLAELRAERSA